MLNVIHDFLSFTFRPEAASSDAMIARLKARNTGNWVDYVRENMKRAKWVGDLLRVPSQDLYQLLDTDQQRQLNSAVTEMGLSVLNRLKELIYDFDFIPRPYGMFGYLYSYSLVRGGKACGVAAWGGRNCGVMVQLTGRACAYTDFGRLHRLVSGLPDIRITRVDLAVDAKRGEYNFEWCKSQYESGGFTSGGRSPSFTEIKSGGLIKEGQEVFEGGRSFYVGKRESGKMFRGYEKGRQLIGQGLKLESDLQEWFRLEVEIHNTARKIPLDVLLNPSDYFAGAYPCLSFISALAKPIHTIKKVMRVEVQKLISHARTSYGTLINLLQKMGKSDSEIVEMLKSKRDRYPSRIENLMYINLA